MPPDVESALTAFQYIDTRLVNTYGYSESASKRNNRQAAMRYSFNNWYQLEQARNGKPPTQQEQEAWVDRALLEAPTKIRRVGRPVGADKPWFELTPEERITSVQAMRASDPVLHQIIINQFYQDTGSTSVDPEDYFEAWLLATGRTP